MKKTGILNPQLMRALTQLGHTDRFMICDAGFPIPDGVERIDLTLMAGIPSFLDCLHAILGECVVEAVVLAEEMPAANPEIYSQLETLFAKHPRTLVPQAELLRQSKDLRFIVRSAEFAPYSNLILTSASGVESYYHDFWL